MADAEAALRAAFSLYGVDRRTRAESLAAFFRGCGHVPVERADTRSAAGVIEIPAAT